MDNMELNKPKDSRQPVVLGRTTIYDGSRIQNGESCLWVDPLSGVESDFPKEKCKVFLTHVPKSWNKSLDGADVFIGEKDKRLLKGQGNFLRCLFRQEGFPNAEQLPLECAMEPYIGENTVVSVRNGEKFFVGQCEVRCIHTPGPTPGHTCLYLPKEQVLFTGELLSQTMGIRVWKGAPHGLEDWMNSLEKIKALPVKQIFPVWNEPADFSERVDSMIRNCYFRVLELFRLVQDHPGLTAYELASDFSRKGIQWENLPLEEKKKAMNETLAYLNYLRERDYVRVREGEDGLVNLPGSRRLTDI